MFVQTVHQLPTSDSLQLSSLPTSQVIQVREYFAKYDLDRNGKLDKEEFSRLIEFSSMPERVVRRAHSLLRKRMQESRNGVQITFREFIQIFTSKDELDACIGRRKSFDVKTKSFDDGQSAEGSSTGRKRLMERRGTVA